MCISIIDFSQLGVAKGEITYLKSVRVPQIVINLHKPIPTTHPHPLFRTSLFRTSRSALPAQSSSLCKHETNGKAF
jgi:hypothetical protein